MNTTIQIALVQHACSDSPTVNMARTVEAIHRAADAGANIVSTSELFQTRYFCQTEDHAHFSLAESIPGPATDALAEVARERGIVVVASLFERRAPGVFHNTAVVLDADGSLAGRYRKMHVPDDPLYYEKFYFTPGDTGFRAFDTRFGRVGVLVCWDQWFPEAARLTALSGAQVIFTPTAIGWHPSEKARYGEAQHSSWETIQRAHSIANGVFIACANRVGFEPTPGAEGAGIEFWGQSFMCGPDGVVLARASDVQEETLLAEIDLSAIETQRTHWPFLRDRRIDAYGSLLHRYLDEDLG